MSTFLKTGKEKAQEFRREVRTTHQYKSFKTRYGKTRYGKETLLRGICCVLIAPYSGDKSVHRLRISITPSNLPSMNCLMNDLNRIAKGKWEWSMYADDGIPKYLELGKRNEIQSFIQWLSDNDFNSRYVSHDSDERTTDEKTAVLNWIRGGDMTETDPINQSLESAFDITDDWSRPEPVVPETKEGHELFDLHWKFCLDYIKMNPSLKGCKVTEVARL